MMSSKTLRHVRVAVYINEDESDDQNENFHTSSFQHGVNVDEVPPPPYISASQPLNKDNLELNNMKAEVLLIDEKSLQLNLISTELYGPYTNISHKMHFDNVGNSSDMIKRELFAVMDNLLMKRKNSCIMRFAIKQEMDIPIFFDLLIKALYKRINHQKYKLQYIRLDCMDLAASMQNPNNHPIEQGFANVAYNGAYDCNANRGIFRLSRASKYQFRSIRDLLLWLVNEYRFKFNSNKGHEKLQFSFSIVDHQQNLFKVKLSLFHIFLNFMNTEDRNHWHHYMDHMGEGCKGLDCKFVHSGLTVSLSNYMEGIENANTLLLFAVPTNIEMAATTIDMLQMAHSAIKNKKRNLFLASTNVNLNQRLPPIANTTECNIPREWVKLNNSLHAIPKEVRLSPLRHPTKRQSMGISLYDENYSSKDFNALSDWYRKIDDCFAKNFQLCETYYGRFFKLKTKQIISHIKNIFKSLEPVCIQQSEKEPHEITEDRTELQKLFDSYHNAQMQFRQISEDIKDTKFEDVLKIYIETKTFNLNNQSFALKQKCLEVCQQNLNLAFDNLSSDMLVELEI